MMLRRQSGSHVSQALPTDKSKTCSLVCRLCGSGWLAHGSLVLRTPGCNRRPADVKAPTMGRDIVLLLQGWHAIPASLKVIEHSHPAGAKHCSLRVDRPAGSCTACVMPWKSVRSSSSCGTRSTPRHPLQKPPARCAGLRRPHPTAWTPWQHTQRPPRGSTMNMPGRPLASPGQASKPHACLTGCHTSWSVRPRQ